MTHKPLIDETHVFKNSISAETFGEIRDALTERPEGFIISVTTVPSKPSRRRRKV